MREMAKLKNVFYKQLRSHYSGRKFKETISLGCADVCLRNYLEDDLTRTETTCVANCYHKYYRYLAYANTLYTFLTKEEID